MCSQCDTRAGSVETMTSSYGLRLQGRRDGQERILGAHESLDATSGRLLQQRDGKLERDGRLLGVGIPERPRDQQREVAGPSDARLRTSASSAGVAAVRLATTRTWRGCEGSIPPLSYSSRGVTSRRR